MIDISMEITDIEEASRGEEVRDSIVSALEKVAEKTFDADDTPTEDSENVVTSDGIYTALAGKQDILTFDSVPTESSTNPVTSDGIYTALQNVSIEMDSVPTDGSDNAVKSNGIYDALALKQNALTFDSTPTASSTNPVTSGGVYTALQNLTPVTMGTVSLTTSWANEGDGIYSQSVSITGATSVSKIDLQPDSTVLAQMITDKCFALGAVNNAGVITVYAYGNAPTVALTVQYTRTEVAS